MRRWRVSVWVAGGLLIQQCIAAAIDDRALAAAIAGFGAGAAFALILLTAHEGDHDAGDA